MSIIRTFIVEDEASDRNDLVARLKKYQDIHNIEFSNVMPDWKSAETLESAYDFIISKWSDIDLIFLDSGLYAVTKQAFLEDAGVELLKQLWTYAEKEHKKMTFKVIVLTGITRVGARYMQLPALIRDTIIYGYAEKHKREDLEQALEVFFASFTEPSQPSIEDHLSSLGSFIINVRHYEDFTETQFVFRLDDILFVKADGSYHRYYLSKMKRDQLQDYLVEETIFSLLQNDEIYKTLYNNLREAKKEAKMITSDSETTHIKIKEKIGRIESDISNRIIEFKDDVDVKTIKIVKYMRFSGGISDFKKMMIDKGLSPFREINSSFIINLNFLSSYYTNTRGRRYMLQDGVESFEVPFKE